PTIKLSEKPTKSSLPGRKNVFRLVDQSGLFAGDLIALEEEALPERMFHPFEPDQSMPLKGLRAERLLNPVLSRGNLTASFQRLWNQRSSSALGWLSCRRNIAASKTRTCIKS